MFVDHIFSDEKYFDRPHEFMPERFLKNSFGVKPEVADDPARRDNLLFGAGRRVCPGIIFAKTSLVCIHLSLLKLCNVSDNITSTATAHNECRLGIQPREGHRSCYGEGNSSRYEQYRLCAPASSSPIFRPNISVFKGITATPLKFNCTIESRSQAHAELINNQFHSVAEHLRVYEYTVSAADRAFNTRYRD